MKQRKADEKLTRELQQWLDTDAKERNLEAGALLLLRLSRNKWLYKHVLLHRDTPKLEYELKKYLRIRLDGMTVADVTRMDREVMPAAAASLNAGPPLISTDADFTDAPYRGRRDDHKQLPADVQQLYERNGELYFKMKQLFEDLKRMNDRPACDRYEFLKILAELDKEYRDNWNTYDTWSAATAGAPNAAPQPAADAPTAQQIQAARKYLSENKAKLSALEGPKADKLRAKMQERVLLLEAAGQGFDDDHKEELISLGLVFKG